MRSLRLTHFRGFADTDAVPLRGITLLIGANSSGKSSFLRVLPLLRQSIETRSVTPIVWYSDQFDLVDFGTLDDVRRHGDDAPVGLEFGLTVGGERWARGRGRPFGPTDIQVRLELGGDAEGTVASLVELRSGSLQGRVQFTERGEVHQVSFPNGNWDLETVKKLRMTHDTLFPFVRIHPRDEELQDQLVNQLQRIGHGRTTPETYETIAGKLTFGTKKHVWSSLRSAYSSDYWRKQLDGRVGKKSDLVGDIRKLLFERDFFRLLRLADLELLGIAGGTVYIKPFRAHPQRYYRVSDLAVDELDPVGANLAMFIRSLTDTEKRDFSSWLGEHLNIELQVRKSGGHVVLQVKQSGGDWFNLVDMGFGYSQILPVLAQVWLGQRGLRPAGRILRRQVEFIAIEQPELHLHPMHQARLADVFVGAVKAAPKMRVVVETHSQALVERLGELVEAGGVSPDDISIVLFHKDGADCEVTLASFDKEGQLQGWPPGFLSW